MIDLKAVLKPFSESGWPQDWGLTPVNSFDWKIDHVSFGFWTHGESQRLYIFWMANFLIDPRQGTFQRGRIHQRPYSVKFELPLGYRMETQEIESRIIQEIMERFAIVRPYIAEIRSTCIAAKGKYMKDYQVDKNV